MRETVQKIFIQTPHDKQVMMFSATLPEKIRPVCRKFLQNVRVLRLGGAAAARGPGRDRGACCRKVAEALARAVVCARSRWRSTSTRSRS